MNFAAADLPWDEWADSVVDSHTSTQVTGPENALGPLDGDYANIPKHRMITLDMGECEQIVDGDGDDFIVYEVDPSRDDDSCQGPDTKWVPPHRECTGWSCTGRPFFFMCIGGNWVCSQWTTVPGYCRRNVDCETVSVAVQDPNEPFTQWIDISCDAAGRFDLSDPLVGNSLETARYVKVLNLVDDPIELDAVRSLNTNVCKTAAPEYPTNALPVVLALLAMGSMAVYFRR